MKITKQIPGYHLLLSKEDLALDLKNGLEAKELSKPDSVNFEGNRYLQTQPLDLSKSSDQDQNQGSFTTVGYEEKLKIICDSYEQDDINGLSELGPTFEKSIQNQNGLEMNDRKDSLSTEMKEFTDKFIMGPNTLINPDSKTELFNFVKGLIEKRGVYPKGTYNNELYKLITNAGISHFG